jgi:hypothetical protein
MQRPHAGLAEALSAGLRLSEVVLLALLQFRLIGVPVVDTGTVDQRHQRKRDRHQHEPLHE